MLNVLNYFQFFDFLFFETDDCVTFYSASHTNMTTHFFNMHITVYIVMFCFELNAYAAAPHMKLKSKGTASKASEFTPKTMCRIAKSVRLDDSHRSPPEAFKCMPGWQKDYGGVFRVERPDILQQVRDGIDYCKGIRRPVTDNGPEEEEETPADRRKKSGRNRQTKTHIRFDERNVTCIEMLDFKFFLILV